MKGFFGTGTGTGACLSRMYELMSVQTDSTKAIEDNSLILDKGCYAIGAENTWNVLSLKVELK